MINLDPLKELVYESDNSACFIERERILKTFSEENADASAPDYCARALSTVLREVSTPIDACDVFAGRVLEAPPDPGLSAPNGLLYATGHMSFNYEKILRAGLKGILQEIRENAAKLGDDKSLEFAQNAEIAVQAIRNFAFRYAAAAKAQGGVYMRQAAEALEKAPWEGAYDFYSALQSVWLVHIIASCYVGGRDYAFGRFDRFMYPYYQKSVEAGVPHEELVGLLAAFFVKANEICGRTTHNYQSKPIPSQASKQYLTFGGAEPNELSFAILEAAERSGMAEPVFTAVLKPDADAAFTARVFQAMSRLTDKLQIYNYDLVHTRLKNMGLPEDIAADFTFSGCDTLDFNYRNIRHEDYMPSVQLFCETLKKGVYHSTEEIAAAYGKKLKEHIQTHVNGTLPGWQSNPDRIRKWFVLDALFIGDCAETCRYPMDSDRGMGYVLFNFFLSGLATMGDSLAALDKMVFKDKRYSYTAFMNILDKNFQGHEDLRLELQNMVKFGNDSEEDGYAVMIAGAFLDALDQVELPENWYAVGGFYSLERDNTFGPEIPATPDGRLAGTPYSENQSPVYGGDKHGITALLKSLSKLPFHRTACGGLNLTFSQKVTPEILQSLVTAYFDLGGIHVGITVLNRAALQDAMVNPEKYKSLTVRLYGFSEYFISLPEWQQLAVLNRTEY